jgi:hypothetical protein
MGGESTFYRLAQANKVPNSIPHKGKHSSKKKRGGKTSKASVNTNTIGVMNFDNMAARAIESQ